MTSFVSLGQMGAVPRPHRTVRRIPWGTATETPDATGLTALACAALFGPDAYRVGHRSSAVGMPPETGPDVLDERLRNVDLAALRRALVTQRAQRMGDRGWLLQRALHLAAWGESCVAALPSAAAAAAITDQQIVDRARDIIASLRTGGDRDDDQDPLAWRGGLYYGARNQHRLAVGVQVPWPGGADAAGCARFAAAYVGRVGAPGVLVRMLAQRQVPYYAAAALPVREHGTACLSVGLSTVAEHVVPLVETVRDLLRDIRDAGIPDAQVPHLRQSVALHEAIQPSDDPFQPGGGGSHVPADRRVPAVAVVGDLPEPTVVHLREAVHGW
ncbi:hypothetical protein [Micromonospora sp. KLBMP9576]|uniref:hypothetical protein n=1 Tax=Micromonospora sp. KLBMP9576 TaxID=3424769 RepID=UPI003D943E53